MAAALPQGFKVVEEEAVSAPATAPQLPTGFKLVDEPAQQTEGAVESPAKYVAPSDMIEVTHPDPRIGLQKFKFGTPESDILRTINRQEIELAKIDAASPQLRLKEAWQQIEDAKNRGEIDAIQAAEAQTKLLKEVPLTQQGAAFAARIGLPLLGEAMLGGKRGLGMAGRVAGSMVGEAVALGLEKEELTGGKILGAGVSALPGGQSGQLAKNIRRFAGAQLAGKATEEALDKESLISLKNAAIAAGEGGAGAYGMKLLGETARRAANALTRKGEYALIKTMIGANELGIIVDPTIYSNAVPKTGLVKIAGGTTKFQDAASRINEEQVVKAANSIIGSPQTNKNFDRAFFASEKVKLSEPYKQIAALSTQADTALKAWREANETFVNSTRAAARETNPKSRIALRDEAKAAKIDADNAFNTIKSEAMATGNGHLIKDLTESRKAYARLYAMEAAANTSSGKLEYPEVWGYMREELKVPFDGTLEKLARISAIMPEVLRSSPALRRAQPIRGMGDIGITEMGSKVLTAPLKAFMAVPRAAAEAALTSAPYQRFLTRDLMQRPGPAIPEQLGRFLGTEYVELERNR